MVRLSQLSALLALALLAGCTTHYDFVPQPAMALLRPNPNQPTEQARILVNVHGLKPPKGPSTIDLNMRVENFGPGPLTFDPREVTVLDSGLYPLGPPSGDLSPATLEPGQAALRTLTYTLPPGLSPGRRAFSMLNVRFILHAGPGPGPMAYPHTLLFYRVYYW